MKRYKKQYSVEETEQYYLKRMHNSSLSKNKRIYSSSWLEGFTDIHSKENISDYQRRYKEIKDCGYGMMPGVEMMFTGYINGAKARAKKKDISHDREKYDEYHALAYKYNLRYSK